MDNKAHWYLPPYRNILLSLLPLGAFVWIALPFIRDAVTSNDTGVAGIFAFLIVGSFWQTSRLLRLVRTSENGISVITVRGAQHRRWDELLALRHVPARSEWLRPVGYPLDTMRGTIYIPPELQGIDELLDEIGHATHNRAHFSHPAAMRAEGDSSVILRLSPMYRIGMTLSIPVFIGILFYAPFPMHFVFLAFGAFHGYRFSRIPMEVTFNADTVNVRYLTRRRDYNSNNLSIQANPAPFQQGTVNLVFGNDKVAVSEMMHGVLVPQLLRLLAQLYPKAGVVERNGPRWPWS